MSHPDLVQQVSAVLKAQTIRERVHLIASHGWTVSQIFDRLPPTLRDGLLDSELNPTVARRKALDVVVKAIFVHVDAGTVRRKRTRLKNAKRAGIDAMVDVYRLR
jgi:hypothetical protein